MFIVVRGDVTAGFKLYGPFDTPDEASASGRGIGLIAPINPPTRRDFRDTPRGHMTVEKYVEYVKDEGLRWVVVRGRLDDGFKFRGPYLEDDADDVCCRVDSDTAFICQMQPGGEL